MLFGGSVLSGLYPAFVLSSFNPALALKGKLRTSRHGQQLRKALVVFQFAATVVLLASIGIVYQQIKYLRHLDLGMNIDQTLVLRAPDVNVNDSVYQETYQALKNELLGISQVKRVSQSSALPGADFHEIGSNNSVFRMGKENNGTSYNYYLYSIDEDFIPMLDITLVAGRNFQSNASDWESVILNEDAVEKLGFKNVEEAIGSKITLGHATIIGVVKNFYQRSPKEAHIPMILRYTNRSGLISMRLESGDIQKTLNDIKQVWSSLYPGSIFHYAFLDQEFDHQYQADLQFGRTITSFTSLAVLIACLGLFGLSSFTIVQRTKEIGIRKVLGASVQQIVALLTGHFIKIILVAGLIAVPVSYFLMNEWLSNYATRISLAIWMFIIPVLVILFIALLTVSVQTIHSALSNPVKALKQE
jgi:putative ABC transport system permease protein